MKIYMLPNPDKESALPVLRQAADLLRADGVQLIFDEAAALLTEPEWQANVLPAPAAADACDMLLTIGGDGTVLHAAATALAAQKPLLGINTGRLGFLTLMESNELHKLHRLPKGEYSVERRSVLCVATDSDLPCHALNDIVLFKEAPERTISLDIYCDGILVSRFRGDGVIFATPTGSTAYSMSAGGPILDARLGGIVVTQICAHIVQTPPLVFAGDRRLQAVNTGTADEVVLLNYDGDGDRRLFRGEEAAITQAGRTVPMVQFNEADQLEFIDKKLRSR